MEKPDYISTMLSIFILMSLMGFAGGFASALYRDIVSWWLSKRKETK